MKADFCCEEQRIEFDFGNLMPIGGLPEGGEKGDILVKQSSEEQDADWYAPANSVQEGNNLPVTSDAVYQALQTSGMTPEEKEKLSGIEGGAEVNVIEEVRQYNPFRQRYEALPVSDKGVNLPYTEIPDIPPGAFVCHFELSEENDELIVTCEESIEQILTKADDKDRSVFGIVTFSDDDNQVVLPLTSFQTGVGYYIEFYGPLSPDGDSFLFLKTVDNSSNEWTAEIKSYITDQVLENAVDSALQEAKASGEFDGADGAQIWWTKKKIFSYNGTIFADIRYFSGGTGDVKVNDYLFALPVNFDPPDNPSCLYSINSVQGNNALLTEVTSLKGTKIWWTNASVLAVSNDPQTQRSRMEGQIGTPDVGDYVFGPEANTGEGTPTELYVITTSATVCTLTWVCKVSGASDYTDLTNKPQIAGTTLTGNKSLSDLGIEPEAFVVTITQSGSTYSADKTYSDTVAAVTAGKRVVAMLNSIEYQLFSYVANSYTVVFTANQGTTAKTIAFSLGNTVSIIDKTLGTYSKPSNGIPATDLASSVQTSLGKADTALQNGDAVASNQGVANAGKFLMVGNDGIVVPTTIPSAQGVSF